jgi:hypothetical protein
MSDAMKARRLYRDSAQVAGFRLRVIGIATTPLDALAHIVNP